MRRGRVEAIRNIHTGCRYRSRARLRRVARLRGLGSGDFSASLRTISERAAAGSISSMKGSEI